MRRQLLEIKADEQDLIQRNKELTSLNNELKRAKESSESLDKDNYSKIRNLELSKSSLERKNKDLQSDKNTLSSEKNKLNNLITNLEKELALKNQKLSRLEIDKENQRARIRDAEAISKSKDELNRTLENNEAKYLDEINELKNEVVRLSGIESLLTERNLNNEQENNDLKDKIRTVTINSDSIEEEFDSLRI